MCQEGNVIRWIDGKISAFSKNKPIGLTEAREAELIELHYLSKQNNYYKGQVESLFILCQDYLNQKKRYNDLFVRAKNIEALSLEENDYKSLSMAKNYLGIALLELGFLEEAKLNFQSSLVHTAKVSEEFTKNTLYFKNFSLLSRYYELIGKNDSAIFYLNKSAKIFNKIPDSSLLKKNYMTDIYLDLAKQFIHSDNTNKAQIYLNKVNNNQYSDFVKADFYFLSAQLQLKINNKKTALEYFKKAETLANEIKYSQLSVKIYDELSDFYDHNNPKEQIFYLKKSSVLKDSIRESSRAQINDINLNSVKSNQSVFDEKTQYLLMFFSVLAVVFGLIFFFRKSIFKRTFKEKVEEKKSDFNLSLAELAQLAYDKDSSFCNTFMTIFPDFESKLLEINPSLKPLDIEVCIYIKLNFSTKQIAQLKNISVRAVEGRKYRMRKALGIKPEENMYLWMSEI